MWYVYVFFSLKDKQLYIGFSNDLKSRYKRHCDGFVRATKYRLPVKLIHYEAYLKMSDARRREKFLKGGKGRGELKVQLRDILTELKYKNLYLAA